MKTFSTPITNEAAAEQSAWVELYDIYLKSAITTPWGSTNIIRLCNRLGKQFSFFAPTVAPEAIGTQGSAATYYPWPLKRAVVKSSGQFADNKLEITGSNVTAEWAGMIAAINWYDTPVVIRKTSPNITGATSADCAILFSGLVDSVRMDDKAITLVCSNDLALLNRILPSENMHTSCRFKWADDQCTAVRFKAENYKSKTVGSGSTTTLVKSSGFTEDTGNSASYGTDIVDALSSGAITASSELTTSAKCFINNTGTMGYLALRSYVSAVKFVEDQPVQFSVYFDPSPPSPFSFGVTYWIVDFLGDKFKLAATKGGSPINYISGGGPWYLNGLNAYHAFRVRMSENDLGWFIGNNADWGTVDNAYYQIPDVQAGLKNEALKPYIQFDFGYAKTPKLWRIQTSPTRTPDESVRILQFFSSTNNSTWVFESYYEVQNRGDTFYDVQIPKASTARYWRICVRSKWGESLTPQMLYRVAAYELSRNWWQDGTITFDAATTTVSLRNVTRKVMESYDGQIVVQELPAAPVSGDTFVIERGCARNFNACCVRLNTENYGGFNDLPTQTVIR